MSKIDEVKEQLNYLKLWLGIVVVTNISLISWLVSNYEEENLKVIADIVAIIVLTLAMLVIDKKIKSKIRSLKDL